MKTVKITSLLIALLFPYLLSASHMIGGEITWKCQSDGKFVFYMTVYRDCTGIPFGYDDETLEIFGAPAPRDQNNAPVYDITLRPDSINWRNHNFGDVTPNCLTYSNSLSCQNGDRGAIQEFRYVSDTIRLSGTPPVSGWHFRWAAPPARGQFENLIEQGVVVLITSMYSGSFSSNGNCTASSPIFTDTPNYLICVGEYSVLSYKASSHASDSLVYEWEYANNTPINSPTPLTYSYSYSFNNPTPDTTINSENIPAQLSSSEGLVKLKISDYYSRGFWTAVSATSYRNGKPIAKVIREHPIYVNYCDQDSINSSRTIFRLNQKDTNFISIEANIGDSLEIPISINNLKIDSLGNVRPHSITIESEALEPDPSQNSQNCPLNSCATINGHTFSYDSTEEKYTLKGDSVYNLVLNWKPNCRSLKDKFHSTIDFDITINGGRCPIPDIYTATISVEINSKGSPTLSSLSCVQTSNGFNRLSWITDTVTPEFNYWIITGSDSFNSTLTPVDTLNDRNLRSYVDSISPFKVYSLETVSELCDTQLYTQRTAKGIKDSIHLQINSNFSFLELNWNDIYLPSKTDPISYDIYLSYDNEAFNKIATVNNRSEYRLNYDSCFNSLRVYVSETKCGKRSKTESFIIYQPISYNLTAQGYGGFLHLDWDDLYYKLHDDSAEYHILVSYDGINYKKLASVYGKSEYNLQIDTCVEALNIYIYDPKCKFSSRLEILTASSKSINLSSIPLGDGYELDWTHNLNSMEVYSDFTFYIHQISVDGKDKVIDSVTYDFDLDIIPYFLNYDHCRNSFSYYIEEKRCGIKSDTVDISVFSNFIFKDSIYEINGVLNIQQQSRVEYTWYKCSTDSLFQDSTNTSFVISDTGSYAVVMKMGYCRDTTNCISYYPIGLEENKWGIQIQLFPNPTSNNIQLQLPKATSLEVKVRDLQGKLLSNQSFTNQKQAVIELNQSPGIYFIEIANAEGEKVFKKVVKQ